MVMRLMEQLRKAVAEIDHVDWNLYDIKLAKFQLAIAKGKSDGEQQKRLEKRLEKLLRQRAKTVWLKQL